MVIFNELVGVQSATGPVGQIPTLRVRYADAFDDVTAGEEAPSQDWCWLSVVEATAKADATATLEGAAGKRLSIQIQSKQSSKNPKAIS